MASNKVSRVRNIEVFQEWCFFYLSFPIAALTYGFSFR
jgi:hypothetical protein